MKRIQGAPISVLLCAAFLAAWAASIPGQQGAPPANNPPVPGAAAVPAALAAEATATPGSGAMPKMVFEKTQIDLGKLVEGPPVEFHFPFSNQGSGDLTIFEVQKSCGCTRAEALKKVLKPGESSEIQGEFNTVGQIGPRTKTITIVSNDPAQPKLTLRFDANVEQKVKVEPHGVYFRDVGIAETTSQTIRLTNVSGKPMRVTGLRSSLAAASARVVSPAAPAESGQPAVQSLPVADDKTPIVIEVCYKAPEVTGPFSGQLVISTDLPDKPTIDVSMNGAGSGDILVIPTTVYFGMVRAGELPSRSFTIRSRSKIPFEITRIDTEGVDLEVTSEPIPDYAGYKIQARLNRVPDQSERMFKGHIRIHTTHPKQPAVDVGVTGVKAPPGLPPPVSRPVNDLKPQQEGVAVSPPTPAPNPPASHSGQ